ncbi:MAG: hypothetical protein CFE34_06695 [Rhodobacteraceae bacterium PARR1]|nr:MAG: hypothetical protein CFE34_06695 [Rhodobacteraceae bacterium PARR1]
MTDTQPPLTPGPRPNLLQALHALEEAAAGPSPDTLAAAPLLHLWSPVLIGADLCLAGEATGHPHLPDGIITTSLLLALAQDLTWARTFSRFYRLNRPLDAALSEACASPNVHIIDAYGHQAIPVPVARKWIERTAEWVRARVGE